MSITVLRISKVCTGITLYSYMYLTGCLCICSRGGVGLHLIVRYIGINAHGLGHVYVYLTCSGVPVCVICTEVCMCVNVYAFI